ncbi:MAG: PH domain-containing protein [Rubripirellula sp.]|nr:PH domain-containing protein [Rubripirellula sp.]
MNDESTSRDTSMNEVSGSSFDAKADEPSAKADEPSAKADEPSDRDTSLMASAASLSAADSGDIVGSQPTRNDGVQMPLDLRWIRLGRTIGMVLLVLAAAFTVAGVYRMFQTIAPPQNLFVPLAWVVLLIIGVVLAWMIPQRRYRHWSYQLGDQVLVVRHGVISRVTVAIPLSRLQHVDLHDGPVTRRFGLSSLEVHTAGTRAASHVIPGLSHQTARELRDQLIAAANRGADVVTRD